MFVLGRAFKQNDSNWGILSGDGNLTKAKRLDGINKTIVKFHLQIVWRKKLDQQHENSRQMSDVYLFLKIFSDEDSASHQRNLQVEDFPSASLEFSLLQEPFSLNYYLSQLVIAQTQKHKDWYVGSNLPSQQRLVSRKVNYLKRWFLQYIITDNLHKVSILMNLYLLEEVFIPKVWAVWGKMEKKNNNNKASSSSHVRICFVLQAQNTSSWGFTKPRYPTLHITGKEGKQSFT